MKKLLLSLSTAAALFLNTQQVEAQMLGKNTTSARQDSLRGSLRPERNWWNVLHYSIHVTPNINAKSISGSNEIEFAVTSSGLHPTMQIDLQEPMNIDRIVWSSNKNKKLSYKREGNAFWVDFGKANFVEGAKEKITIFFSGVPKEAKRAPWDGGWIWQKDEKGRPWITVACQGLGASVWYPNKDHQSDEPDNGVTLKITVPDSLSGVGNGKLTNKQKEKNGNTTWTWNVTSPINNYNVIPYIGAFANWESTFNGEKGLLPTSFWVLDYNLEKAKAHFGRDVNPMLNCFEYWFGPYPFYEDSYKMIETSHLGMEHQSAVAYGNKYLNGYLGRDQSGTGTGLSWDFIIIHESGHEWFGNNITTNDVADMWVHEGFTSYSEALFVECQQGKAAGDLYAQGIRKNIANRAPVIGQYGVNQEGSGDMYPKGANLLHTIREAIQDDNKFRMILRGLNAKYYHKTVNTADVEKYISDQAGYNFQPVFDQYLRNIAIPVLEYKTNGNELSYRWTNAISTFNLPLIIDNGTEKIKILPTAQWQNIKLGYPFGAFQISKNYYIQLKEVK